MAEDRSDAARDDPKLRRAILIVGLLNLAYFALQGALAFPIASVSLFADAIDFLEDASINFLILLGLGWGAAARARLGMVLALVLALPSIAALGAAAYKLFQPVPPVGAGMSLVSLGALVVNLSCALLLARFRHREGSLVKAAFYSARNDAAANIGIILVGLVTVVWASHWPDLVLGLLIFALNADAALKVYRAGRRELKEGAA